MFDRMVNQLSAAAATTSTTGTSTTSAQAAAVLMRIGGLSDRMQDKSTEDPLREEDGLLSLDTAETILKWHAEAVGRCVELTPSNDVYVCLQALGEFSHACVVGQRASLRYSECYQKRSQLHTWRQR